MTSIFHTPPSLFSLVETCPQTVPRVPLSRRQWSPNAALLDQLLHHLPVDWATLDLATLDNLRDETWDYPTVDDVWEFNEDDLPDPHAMNGSAWNVVARAAELVAYQTLPVIPDPHHPFY